jgi:hypothetical protein
LKARRGFADHVQTFFIWTLTHEHCAQTVLLSPRALAVRWDTSEGALRGAGVAPVRQFIRLGPKTVRDPLAGVEARERELSVFASIGEAQAARADTAELEKERARHRASAHVRPEAAEGLCQEPRRTAAMIEDLTVIRLTNAYRRAVLAIVP